MTSDHQLSTTSLDESSQKGYKKLQDLFLSRKQNRVEITKVSIEILTQYPVLASQRFRTFGVEGQSLHPLSILLGYARTKILPEQLGVVCDSYPPALYDCPMKIGSNRGGYLPLHIACWRSSPEIVIFLARYYPKAVRYATTRLQSPYKLPIHILFEDRKTELAQFFPAMRVLLEIAPETVLRDDFYPKKNLLRLVIEKGDEQLFRECLLERLPKDFDTFKMDAQLFRTDQIRMVIVLLPKLKSLTLCLPRFGYLILGRSCVDTLFEHLLDIDQSEKLEHLEITARSLAEAKDTVTFSVQLLSQRRSLQSLRLGFSYNWERTQSLRLGFSREQRTTFHSKVKLFILELAPVLEAKNTTTHVEIDIDDPTASRSFEDPTLDRFWHFSFLNKHGRAHVRHPQTSVSEFVEHLDALMNKEDSSYLRSVKHSVVYGLLREAPGLWSGSSHCAAKMPSRNGPEVLSTIRSVGKRKRESA